MIFGIGLSNTGSTSLSTAMQMLGYKCVHCPTPEEWARIDEYDFVCDLPTQSKYKQLDKEYFGAQFILTVREKDSWLDSMERWVAKHGDGSGYMQEYRRELYGCDYSRDVLGAIYDRYHDGVREHFCGRDDLLEMNICAGDGWDVLIPFVGARFPKTSKFRQRRR